MDWIRGVRESKMSRINPRSFGLCSEGIELLCTDRIIGKMIRSLVNRHTMFKILIKHLPKDVKADERDEGGSSVY